MGLGLLLVLLVVGVLLLATNSVLVVSGGPGLLVVLLGCSLRWFVVGTAGCVVVGSSSSCPVWFGTFIGLATFSSFLTWNISWISTWILDLSGFPWRFVVWGFCGLLVVGLGFVVLGLCAGSETAAATPTLSGSGWGCSWRPIFGFGFGLVPIWRRVASLPPS